MMAGSVEFKKFLSFLEENKYKDVKVLDNGTVIGTIDLMFTRGLCVGLNWDGWESRYCYEDRELASRAASEMVSDDHPPLPGYIAQRGLIRDFSESTA
jgi:hypothetical protein